MIEKIIDIVGKVFPSVSARRNIIDEMQKEITRLNEKQTQYENWQKTFEIRYSQDACIRINCSELAHIYVPAESVDAYKTAPY